MDIKLKQMEKKNPSKTSFGGIQYQYYFDQIIINFSQDEI